jgi:hypothetical protein
MKERRESEPESESESESVKTGGGVQESGEGQANTSTDTLPDKWADTLSEDEQDFVSEYLAAGLPTDRGTIEANVRRNLSEFGPAGVNTEQVIQAVQEVVES